MAKLKPSVLLSAKVGLIQTGTLVKSLFSFPARTDLTATGSDLGTRGEEHLAEGHCLRLLSTDSSMASVLGHNETSVTEESILTIGTMCW